MGSTLSQPRITGATRPVGLLGWPVAHSRSPAMHNAAFAALGLDHIYVPLAVPPGRIGWAVRGLAALGFAGANVTVPHKAAVLPFLDALSPAATALTAANTILVRPDGSLFGDNTDGPGFLADLAAHGMQPAGRQVLLLGAGGAARAVGYALAAAGAIVNVVNRTVPRAQEFCLAIREALPGVQVAAYPFPQSLPALAPQADLIVNATSLGLHAGDDVPWDRAVPFHPGQTVYDLIYVPARGGSGQPTPFLNLAAAGGAHTVDGLGMLVQQGARSFELWTGRPAPIEVMADAVRSEY